MSLLSRIGRQEECHAPFNSAALIDVGYGLEEWTSPVGDQANILSPANGNVEERRDARSYHNGIELRRTSHHECKSTETNLAVN